MNWNERREKKNTNELILWASLKVLERVVEIFLFLQATDNATEN